MCIYKYVSICIYCSYHKSFTLALLDSMLRYPIFKYLYTYRWVNKDFKILDSHGTPNMKSHWTCCPSMQTCNLARKSPRMPPQWNPQWREGINTLIKPVVRHQFILKIRQTLSHFGEGRTECTADGHNSRARWQGPSKWHHRSGSLKHLDPQTQWRQQTSTLISAASNWSGHTDHSYGYVIDSFISDPFRRHHTNHRWHWHCP